MSIISHTIETSPQSDTRMYVTYTFVDHLGVEIQVEHLVPIDFDTEAYALLQYPIIEAQQVRTEIEEAFGVAESGGNPDKVPNYQTQVEFDRRLLGRLMTESNAYVILNSLPFWQATQTRGGNNAVQRAEHLGVPKLEYDLVGKRFGDTQGAAVFLTDAKGQVWDSVLDAWV